MKLKHNASRCSSWLPFAVAIVIGAALAILAMVYTMVNRGNDVPPGSSLKVDPEGTRLLYESLTSIPELRVERNSLRYSQVETDPNSVWLMLGCSGRWETFPSPFPFAVDKDDTTWLTEYVENGGRLVLTFFDDPANNEGRTSAILQASVPKPGPGVLPTPATGPGTPTPKATPVGPIPMFLSSEASPAFFQKWGVDIGWAPVASDGQDHYVPVLAKPTDGELPPLRWMGGHYFTALTPEWTTVYKSYGRAVIVERPLGKGSIVLAGDTSFLMNQALHEKPNGKILNWLIDDRSQVVFDETHLGIKSKTGVMALVMRYRLHWFGFALVVVALLYAWRASMPLTPHRDPYSSEDYTNDGTAGSDGMDGLLARHLPAKELIKTCVTEWELTEAKKRPNDEELTRRLELIQSDEEIPLNHSLIVEAYRRICSYLKRT